MLALQGHLGGVLRDTLHGGKARLGLGQAGEAEKTHLACEEKMQLKPREVARFLRSTKRLQKVGIVHENVETHQEIISERMKKSPPHAFEASCSR